MRGLLLLLMCFLTVWADKVVKYGFELKDNRYHLITLEDGQNSVCVGKICSILGLYVEENRTLKCGKQNNDGINIYANNLFFLPDNKLVLGTLENEILNKSLNSHSAKEALNKLKQDKETSLKNSKCYGNEFEQKLEISKITKDRIFFDNFVSFSYSGAAHPSFYESGFALDTNKMELKTYLLSDVVEDSPKFRTFISKILQEYLKTNKKSWADWDERDYFGSDELSFNILKQEVVFKEKGLYINLRLLLSEAGRDLDFFEVPYENLRTFAKGDLHRVLRDF